MYFIFSSVCSGCHYRRSSGKFRAGLAGTVAERIAVPAISRGEEVAVVRLAGQEEHFFSASGGQNSPSQEGSDLMSATASLSLFPDP